MTTATATREITPGDFLMEPTPLELCGKGARIGRKGEDYMLLRYFCKRWDCPWCSEFMGSQWREKILAQSDSYYSTEIAADQVSAAVKRIRKAEGQYWVVRDNGTHHLLATVDTVPGSTLLTRENGLQALLKQILGKEAISLGGKRKIRHSQLRSQGMEDSGSAGATDEAAASAGTSPLGGEAREPWEWVTVTESPEEIGRRLEEVGCVVRWNGSDRASVATLSEEGRRLLDSVFPGSPDPPLPFRRSDGRSPVSQQPVS